VRWSVGEYFGFLRNIYFFRDLSDEEVEHVERLCDEERYPAGTIIFEEGSQGDKFYIVLSGAVEVWKDFHTESPDRIAVHGAGYLFGEMALIDDMPRSATVRAQSDTRLLYLGQEGFRELLGSSSTVGISVIRSLSAMVRKSNQSFLDSLRRRNQELEKAYADLKETQQELIEAERLSNIGKFSSMILHDIRNPISTVRGYAEMIRLNNEDPQRVEKYAKSIEQEAGRLNQLAGELLDYSRGEIRPELRIVSIDQLLERFRQSIQDRFGSRDIEIDIDCQYHDPVLLDEERILRVLLNLAENARKAMPRGGSFRVRVEHEDSQLVFSVEDTGEGMSKEVLDRIFEPFYSSSKDGGTGLGMVIVKNVIEAHEGKLNIESTPREGTRVTIRLPLKG
jgi:signal transduction histidine kinase